MSIKRSRTVDHLGFIRQTLRELAGYSTLAYELIQNADDTDETQRATRLRFDIRDEALWVEDDGGFTDCGDQDLSPDECLFMEERGHRCDFHSFRLPWSADKRLRDNTTGVFGIGFTAVYQITDRPEIISGRRYWIIDETADPHDRISEDDDPVEPPHEGTRIILPWARNPNSMFRRKVGAAAVPRDVKERMRRTLENSIPPAMLFLRHLRQIELALDGRIVRVLTREADGDEVVIKDDGQIHRWRLVRGSFDEEEKRLREQHTDLIEPARRPIVSVAIPHNFGVDGRLCTTLPTAQPTHLPVHINAEFYLAADRRHLAMGMQYQNDWNSAAIDCAAQLLAGALGELPELLGPKRLWSALESARGLTLGKWPDPVDETLGAFWDHLEPKIADHDLVWTSDGGWVTVGDARFVSPVEDEGAFPVLEQLGVALVAPALRAHRNILLTAGVRDLSVEDVVAALGGVGLDDCTPITALPEPLDYAPAREQLWAQLGRMVDRLKRNDRQREAAKKALETAAVVPSTDGQLCPIYSLWRTDTGSVELLSTVAPEFPFLDHQRLPEEAEPLAHLCDELTASGAVAQLGDQRLRVNLPLARRLIRWFAQREDELDDEDLEGLAELAIFPSANGVHPLAEVALPGDFEDPLGLALLVERETGREHISFLDRLGIERLSFAVYACEQIPRAFDEGQLTVDERHAIVSLLAQQKGQLDDVPHARAILADVPLVECTDGTWRVAREVYFKARSVAEVLGPRAPLAKLPEDHTDAAKKLLAWLGVADEPRAADVVAQVEKIASKGADAFHRKIVENTVAWLGQRWAELKAREREEFAPLRRLRWLPARTGNAWHAPADLDAIFRDYLYESQGRFVGIDRQVQVRAVDFLGWLGLGLNPTVQQVVAHLRHCSETDTPPNREVYRFLDGKAEEPVVQRLRDVKCLHIDGRWRGPNEVYWSDHPFGGWRVRIGQDFTHYGALLESLGVKHAPDHGDAMAVITEISEKYVTYNQKVPEEDLKVLRNCWEICEVALNQGELDEAQLASFGKQRVIPDRRDVLTEAPRLFFEDLPGLADEIAHIRSHVIQKPAGAWHAMQAAGVRDLSRVADARVIEVGDRRDDGLSLRITEREEELARVIDPHITTVHWRQIAARLGELHLLSVTSLTVRWEVEAFNRRFTGEPGPKDALWQTHEESLYVVVAGGVPVWEALARELVRALLPGVEPSVLAPGIATALRYETREATKRALDAAGFSPLAPEIRAEIETATATDLDAEEVEHMEIPVSEEYSDDEAEEVVDGEGDNSSWLWEGATEEVNEEDVEYVEEVEQGEQLGTGIGTQTEPEHTSSRDDENGRRRRQSDSEGTEKSNGRRSAMNQPRSRLRSYVVPDDRGNGVEEPSHEAGRNPVDEAGVEAVLRYETDAGREPEEQPHNKPGYDVLARDQSGDVVRYIEVKSSAGQWDQLGVGLSRQQYRHAWRNEDQYWLYVVEYAFDDEQRRIWPISDPARKVTEYIFDEGWKDVAERGEVEEDDL